MTSLFQINVGLFSGPQKAHVSTRTSSVYMYLVFFLMWWSHDIIVVLTVIVAHSFEERTEDIRLKNLETKLESSLKRKSFSVACGKIKTIQSSTSNFSNKLFKYYVCARTNHIRNAGCDIHYAALPYRYFFAIVTLPVIYKFRVIISCEKKATYTNIRYLSRKSNKQAMELLLFFKQFILKRNIRNLIFVI